MASETEEKVGVYICYCGGNISDHVDVEKVAENMKGIPGVAVARTNMFMCSDPGQELIMEDIKNGVVNRVVVASCAPALHELTFRGTIQRAGMNPYLYDHANIREQVSWVHHGDAATDKATTLVAASIGKARHLSALSPIRVEARNHATVIGGGMAGLRAAKDLSKRGIEVLLLEKSPFLGGQAAQLDKLFPTEENAGDLIKHLSREVLKDSNITILTCADIVKSEGYVGNFKITIKRHPPESEEYLEKLDVFGKSKVAKGDFVPFSGVCPAEVPTRSEEFNQDTGSLVFATGFKTYIPNGEYGYGEHPEIITLPQLIRMMAQSNAQGGKLEINGKKINRAAMIHCVGSRQIPGIHEPDAEGNLNEYCSRVCCSATLQAVNEIREKHPETHVFEFYRDIRTYGRGHEAYYERASQNNVIFFRFEADEPPVVEKTEEGSQYPLKIRVKDTLTFGEELEAEVDLVVLSVGMEPNNVSDLVDMMKLPVGVDRFLLEVHPKLQPVELAKTGILLAGTCQAPMDIGEVCSAAQAASAKVATLLSRGYVELDPFVAEINIEKCTGSGNCADVCPVEGAIWQAETESDGEKTMRTQINPALCTGCGICVAVCPDNAIDINGWTLGQYEAMVDAIVEA